MSKTVAILFVLLLMGAVSAGEPDGGMSRGDLKQEKAVSERDTKKEKKFEVPKWFQPILTLVGLALGIYVSFIIMILLFEPRFIYHPSRKPAVPWEEPGITVEDCWLKTEDGWKLHGWWLEATEEAPTLLAFHGNAGNLTHRVEYLHLLRRKGFNVLMIDYRGYGQSQGHPSETGLYKDAKAAYKYLTEEKKIAPGRIIAFGRSLGTAVALNLALSEPVVAVILESPFASAKVMAKKMIPFVPVSRFIRSDFDNAGRVSELEKPILVIHGDRDRVVPFEQGRAVFEATKEPKEFYRIGGAGHNDTYQVGGKVYFDRLMSFCRESMTGSS
ncbi:MAG: alpha/beta hydrolase [Candidatus Brocadiia bacterium]